MISPIFIWYPYLTHPASLVYNRTVDVQQTGRFFSDLVNPDPWYKSHVPNFRALRKDELPEGIDSGSSWTSVCINTAIYLPWLTGQCLKNGVVVKRAVLKHISEAANLHHSGEKADIVVNCSGLLASKLGGVEDKTVVPVRGQIVVVRNDPGVMFTISGTDDGEDELCYVMQRAAGGGTVLGGTYTKGNWESVPDPNIAVRIMKRAVKLVPALTKGGGIEKLDVVRHGVGLRPFREDGVRIEKERMGGAGGFWTVHNYGHAGWGYQGSYGCAEGVVELVDEIVKSPKAKL
jgi:D-amino-acid oxidase